MSLLRATLITVCSWAVAFGVTWALVQAFAEGGM